MLEDLLKCCVAFWHQRYWTAGNGE